MATRDAAGILRPGMFEETRLSDDPEDSTVGVPISGRGNKTTMKARGDRAVEGKTFQTRSVYGARWSAEAKGAVTPPKLSMPYEYYV